MKKQSRSLRRLFNLVDRLRGPDGCPWDREQQVEDLRSYLLEEAHELASAIDAANWDQTAGELGDLLFQVVFITRLGEEHGAFDFEAVVSRIEAKMIHRHPHVFGSEDLPDSQAVHQAWERRKMDDAAGRQQSLLDGLPHSLPALLTAYRMTQKAAGVGFDWPDARAVLTKVDEELAELRAEIEARPAADVTDATRDELGDLLFTLANLSRHLGLDPEAVLARANAKFRRRFATMEAALAKRGIGPGDLDPESWDIAWREAKKSEPG